VAGYIPKWLIHLWMDTHPVTNQIKFADMTENYQLELKTKTLGKASMGDLLPSHHETGAWKCFSSSLSGVTGQRAVAMFKRLPQRWPTSTKERHIKLLQLTCLMHTLTVFELMWRKFASWF